MLKGIDPLVTPELLHALAAMGHGDVLALVDRNYPSASSDRPVIRLAGADLMGAAAAISSLLPIDTFVDRPVAVMQPVDGSPELPAVQRDVLEILEEAEGRPLGVEQVERLSFYERVRHARFVVETSESRPYGCLLITKGVI
ncbi:MAG: RbsD/FucU family protein [Actinomycetes bacterium]